MKTKEVIINTISRPILANKTIDSIYCSGPSRIEVETVCTGYQGGDAGHGGLVSLEVVFRGLCIEGEVVENALGGNETILKLIGQGDWEQEAIIDALERAVSRLRETIPHSAQHNYEEFRKATGGAEKIFKANLKGEPEPEEEDKSWLWNDDFDD